MSTPAQRRTESVSRNQPKEPPIPESKPKEHARSSSQIRRTPNVTKSNVANPATQRDFLLHQLKKEREELLKKKLVPKSDDMIKTIDAQLKRFRVSNK